MVKTIAWNTGHGDITLTYIGQGNDSVTVDTDINDDEDSREQVLTFSGGGIARQVTVRQEACPVNFRTSEGDIIKTSDGYYMNVAEPKIPGYRILEWIQNPSTAVIDTGITNVENTDAGEVDFEFDNVVAQRRIVTVNGTAFQLYVNGSTSFGFRYRSGWRAAVPNNTVKIGTNRIVWLCDTKNSNNVINGTTYSFSYTGTSETAPHTLKLCGNNGGNLGMTGYVYGLKIWRNDVLVRKFIPVRRLSDNKVGMYDIVNDTFYSSTSSVAFIGGPVVIEKNIEL